MAINDNGNVVRCICRILFNFTHFPIAESREVCKAKCCGEGIEAIKWIYGADNGICDNRYAGELAFPLSMSEQVIVGVAEGFSAA